MLPKAVTDYLQTKCEQHLQKLFELLRIPSIANNDDGNCDRAVEWLKDYLIELGMDVQIMPTEGSPNLLATIHVSDSAPTLLIYGHYDVQPPGDPQLWQSPAFEPEVRDGWIYARGADDDKGQLLTHIMAIEAWQKAGGGVPVNIKLFIEGEEEIGSPRLEPFMVAHADELSADAAVLSDSAFYSVDEPAITYALRGILYVELSLDGPDRELHSGLYGGAVTNPINGLSAMIGKMHDPDGRVTIAGFYDDVLPLSDEERAAWAKLNFDADKMAKDLHLEALGGGEKVFSALERIWARPTLDCNGIVGGFIGEGAKTIIPTSAKAKISMRLVANQRPEKILEGFEKFVAQNTPAGLRPKIEPRGHARPVLLPKDSPAMTAAKDAIDEAFGGEMTFIRCGATIPVTEPIQRILGLEAVLMGFGLPEDSLHSPNEKFKLTQLYGGAVAAAAFLNNLRERVS